MRSSSMYSSQMSGYLLQFITVRAPLISHGSTQNYMCVVLASTHTHRNAQGHRRQVHSKSPRLPKLPSGHKESHACAPKAIKQLTPVCNSAWGSLTFTKICYFQPILANLLNLAFTIDRTDISHANM